MSNIGVHWREIFTFDVFLQHVVNDGVDVFIHIREEEREAILDGQLQLLEEVWVIEGAHLQQALSLVLTPGHTGYIHTYNLLSPSRTKY